MRTRTGILAGAATALAIACGTDTELASGAMRHAGDAMVDAGQAMLGMDLDGSVSAQADAAVPAQARRTLVSTCDQVRSYTYRDQLANMDVTKSQRFARFDVGPEGVRSVWMCGDTSYVADKCPAGQTCTGAVVGKAECVLGVATWTDDSAVWVACGQAATVRVVVD